MNEFSRDGIVFRYPTNWSLEVDEATDGSWTVSLTSPATAFVLVSLRPDAREPADLADQTLQALKSDYQELDAENRVETIGGQMAIGHDIDFLTLDTAITCRTRCVESLGGPLLILTQVSEYDREQHDPVLRAIVASFQFETE
jgi:hypothetical protein